MNISIKYILERWPLGWLICSARPDGGIPLDAIKEYVLLMPRKSVIDAGIAHHYNVDGYRNRVVMAITTAQDGETWRSQIADNLKYLEPQERWWKGTDVGKSSATIFGEFADRPWKVFACAFGQAMTPADADDFGRCKRLLDQFPDWRLRLSEIAANYPGSKWAAVVGHWDLLEHSPPERQTEILRELNS